jgi:hypothetical protein
MFRLYVDCYIHEKLKAEKYPRGVLKKQHLCYFDKKKHDDFVFFPPKASHQWDDHCGEMLFFNRRLMEADFNFYNELMFAKQMMDHTKFTGADATIMKQSKWQ